MVLLQTFEIVVIVNAKSQTIYFFKRVVNKRRNLKNLQNILNYLNTKTKAKPFLIFEH